MGEKDDTALDSWCSEDVVRWKELPLEIRMGKIPRRSRGMARAGL
jgi:hypothetical protein